MSVVNPFSSSLFQSDSGQSLQPQGGRAYVSGSRDEPLAFITVSQLLDRACAEFGASDAAIFPAQNGAMSWYSLRDRADDLAAGLLALGVEPGDRVAIWSPNREEWLIAQFGTARIGAILVNINTAYLEGELEYALNKVEACVLIMARGMKSSDYVALLRKLAPEIDQPHENGHPTDISVSRLPALRHIVVVGEGELPPACMAWSVLLRTGGPAHKARLSTIASRLDPDDSINIQFTSGTTGAPKGATLSHYNIVNNARYTAAAMALTARDRVCIPVPLYHCFGMVLGVLACTSVGATMVFPSEAFSAEETLTAVSDTQSTALYGVPTMFVAMLEQLDTTRHNLSTLRTGIMAGASCPAELMQRVINDMNLEQITIAYGMTETSPVSFQTSLNDPVHRRVSTVGRVHPHVEVKIIDEQGHIVEPGRQGELCTRGYSVMKGYWGDSAESNNSAQQPIDQAGWMHTGDLAIIDAEGYCAITGRLGDMIIRGGENIYPVEIEEFLLTHPLIAQAQVFGVPHAKLGEEVCAWCVLESSATLEADDIKRFCEGAMAHYKIPALVRFVQEYPMTVTGKVRKVEMRDQMVEALKTTGSVNQLNPVSHV